MAKDNLETRTLKAILSIKDKVTDIDNVLRDLSHKLCYLIRDRKDYSHKRENNQHYA